MTKPEAMTHFCGVPFEALSREDLIDVVKLLCATHEQRLECSDRLIDFLLGVMKANCAIPPVIGKEE